MQHVRFTKRAKEYLSKEKISEWQLCPKCLGNGVVHDFLPTMSTSPVKQCDVCLGAKILIKPIIKDE